MKHEIFYRCDYTSEKSTDNKHLLAAQLFETKSDAWSEIIYLEDVPHDGASTTRNAAIKRLKRQGWRVEKVAVVDAHHYQTLCIRLEAQLKSATFWRNYAEKHCEKFELETEILEDQIEQLKKENKIFRDLDADHMAGWDAYMRLEKQMYRPKLAYMGLGAALASIGIIGADLLLKAFG